MHQLLPNFTRSYSLHERTHTCNALALPSAARRHQQRHRDDWQTCSTNMRMLRVTLRCRHLTPRAGKGNSGLLAREKRGPCGLRPCGTENAIFRAAPTPSPPRTRLAQRCFTLTPVLVWPPTSAQQRWTLNKPYFTNLCCKLQTSTRTHALAPLRAQQEPRITRPCPRW